jgi:hypothetical protein
MKKLLNLLIIFSLFGTLNAYAEDTFFDYPGFNYTNDDTSVYYDGNLVEGADAETFEVLNGYDIGKDKNGVYYRDEIFMEADFDTLEEVNSWYYKDKDHVYYSFNTFQVIPGADPDTFKANEMDVFATDKNNVYRWGEILEGADPETYESLSYNLSRDKNYLYYRTERIELADPKTFEWKTPNIALDYIESYREEYGNDPTTIEVDLSDYPEIYRDKNNIYIADQVVEGADPDTFEIIDQQYFKDKNYVYYNPYWSGEPAVIKLEKIEGADPDSFEVIREGLSKDKNSVFYGSSVSLDDSYLYSACLDEISPAGLTSDLTEEEVNEIKQKCAVRPDAETYEVLSPYYSKDKNNHYFSYYSPQLISEADYYTFELINEFLAKDKNHVYYKQYVLDWIDASTLTVVNKKIIADENAVYNVSDYPEVIEGISTVGLEGFNDQLFRNSYNFYEIDGDSIYIIEGISRHGFEIIDDRYAKDNAHVYDLEDGIRIMNGLDPKTFEVINGYYTKDKYGVHGSGRLDLVDPKTFEVINEGYNMNYAKDASKVYVNSTVIPYADPDTFEHVGLAFSKDKRHVYMFAKLLEGVGTDLELLNDSSDSDYYWFNYITDGEYIYVIDGYGSVKRLDWVDLDTFEIVDDYRFRDKSGLYENLAGYSSFSILTEECYVDECEFSSSDVNSIVFEMNPEIDDYVEISYFYVKDEDNAYYLPYGIEDIDSAMPIYDIHSPSFEVVEDYYTKDKDSVYYRWFTISGADPETFEALGDDIAMDRNHVYYQGNVVPNVDRETFEIVETEIVDEWYSQLDQESLDELEKAYGTDWFAPEIEREIMDKNGTYEILYGRFININDKQVHSGYLERKLLNGGFTDVSDSEYRYSIEDLAARGVINGYDDGSFRPNDPINRAEALKIIFESLDYFPYYNYQDMELTRFSDIEEGAWYKPYVIAGLEEGIVNGYPDGTFQGGNTINLAEVLKMLFEAHDIKIASDGTGIWYTKYYESAKSPLILPENDMEPSHLITRGEFAKMVDVMLLFEENGLYGEEWDNNQDYKSRSTQMESGVNISHELRGSNQIKWSWNGSAVEDGVLFELWTGDRLLGRTNNRWLITEYDECELFQSVRLRVSELEDPTEDDWSIWSKPYEIFIGEDGAINERETVELLMECLKEDKNEFSDVSDFRDIIVDFDPLAELNLGRATEFAFCMTSKKMCEFEYSSDYGIYDLLMFFISHDLYSIYSNGNIPKSAVYSIISGINNLSDFERMLHMAQAELSKRIRGNASI